MYVFLRRCTFAGDVLMLCIAVHQHEQDVSAIRVPNLFPIGRSASLRISEFAQPRYEIVVPTTKKQFASR